ncbi:unnamed protein product [Ixodes persulcatus]
MHLEMHCQQKDLTIQQLRDQVGQDNVALQIPSAERLLELQRQFADKERLLQESQAQVCLKLHEAEDKISQLESALEHTQCELLKARGKSDTNGSRSDEMEMLMTDLERANQRAVAAEQESVRLRDQLSEMDSPRDETAPPLSRTSLELQLEAKDREISQLVEDIRKLQSAVDALKETSASQIAQLEEMLAEKSRIIQDLEDRLDRQKDYEDVKQELRLEDLFHRFCGTAIEPALKKWHRSVLENRANSDRNAAISAAPATRGTAPRLLGVRTNDVFLAGSPSAPLSSSSRLQNVEAFGSLLGEEIVSSFSRMLKSEQQPPGLVATSPPTTPKSVEADTLSTGTESSTGSNPNQTRCSDDATGASLERLQECLRQNMERYACEALNTQNIARVVRELLSVHNVGQRLFARFVLGLSQGTVSELLSKPKPWDKLTEKGRDSYRKMHAWASDDFCVFMLKSLVPKKGKEAGGPNAPCRQEDAAAEERIAQILSEAQQAMITPKKERSPAPCSGGSSGTQQQNDAKRSSRKYENDDIPQEMVARIYQEELAKLMGQRVEESFRQQQYDRTHEEIRQALSIYHQELSRLSQLALTPGHEFARFGAALPGALLNGAFPGLSLAPEARGTGGARGADPAADALRHHGAEQRTCRSTTLNAQPSPRDWHKRSKYRVLSLAEASAPCVAEDLGSSPLQRMQSITNSLLSQTSTPAMPASNQRQAKAVLPPITQQQFDQYNNLNTEEIVKKLNEVITKWAGIENVFAEATFVQRFISHACQWLVGTQTGTKPVEPKVKINRPCSTC